MDILLNNRERYVRPSSWDDCYESYLLQELDDRNSRKALITELYNTVSPQNYITVVRNFMLLWHAKHWAYAQCWSKTSDSDAMWRIYSYGKHSIQISSTRDLIIKMIKDSDHNGKCFNKGVKYDVDTSIDVFRDQILGVKKTLNPYEPYFHKRSAFDHEKEYRFLIDDYQKTIIAKLCGDMALFKLDVRDKTDREIIDCLCEAIEGSLDSYNKVKDEIAISKYLKIGDLSQYITEVRVNPFAESWYVDLVETLCKQKNLNFGGKSQLYTRT